MNSIYQNNVVLSLSKDLCLFSSISMKSHYYFMNQVEKCVKKAIVISTVA